jgi:hypothetical protein
LISEANKELLEDDKSQTVYAKQKKKQALA